MPYSRFDSAQIDDSGTVTVSGPLNFAADEQEATVVTSVSFVIVQDDQFTHGFGDARGTGSWAGASPTGSGLSAGPAQGHGVALMVREAEQKDDGPKPPVVQTLAWSEAITISGPPRA